jgi:hypothetical protein
LSDFTDMAELGIRIAGEPLAHRLYHFVLGCATLELIMPAQRFAVRIRRRKAERVIDLDWSPLARRLETPPCEFSYSADRPRLVCDDALHLVTAEGLSPCTDCGRVFCRACHREHCPKCQRPVVAATNTVAQLTV